MERYKSKAPKKSSAKQKAEAKKEAIKAVRRDNHRQSQFISHYLRTGNAARSMILSGYSPNNVNVTGSQMLANPSIAERIATAQARMAERTEITMEKVLRELAKIGMSNMGDYIRIAESGDPHIDLSDLDPDQWAAVSEVITETYMEGSGDDAIPVKRIKIKLHPKDSALDKLARILGGYKGKGGMGDDDSPASVTHYTLQIGNANIVLQPSAQGQSSGTDGHAAQILELPRA